MGNHLGKGPSRKRKGKDCRCVCFWVVSVHDRFGSGEGGKKKRRVCPSGQRTLLCPFSIHLSHTHLLTSLSPTAPTQGHLEGETRPGGEGLDQVKRVTQLLFSLLLTGAGGLNATGGGALRRQRWTLSAIRPLDRISCPEGLGLGAWTARGSGSGGR